MMLLLNQGAGADGSLEVDVVPIRMTPGFAAPSDWRGGSNAFNAVLADLDGDGRRDIGVNVLEFEASDATGWHHAGLGWLEQPTNLAEPWSFHRIGHTLPDWVIGIGMADIDGDGDLDAVTGGYSGLNVVRGGYSGASRDFDDPSVTTASSVARLAWFENPGDARGSWQRHDISRRVRGMYDEFAFTTSTATATWTSSRPGAIAANSTVCSGWSSSDNPVHCPHSKQRAATKARPYRCHLRTGAPATTSGSNMSHRTRQPRKRPSSKAAERRDP